ncbi:hypothetical protein [Neobacillus mesonae]|uniref:hypothetical protein n=1 Tax=Neobacillus mesonae TaxID=1193713 RepID=UPI00203DB241|nr:hypothetical protein [Neobacillus mesonae]MCM3569495.1 hypothetical protein [Neobacillus mesonae]
MLTDDLQAKANYINEHTEKNEAPKPNTDVLKDPQVLAAVDYLLNIKDEDLQNRISTLMPFGELMLYNTYPKGQYPPVLIDKEYKIYVPILKQLKAMSQSEALDSIIDQTLSKMHEAWLNDDAEMYLGARNKINVIKQTSEDRIRESL